MVHRDIKPENILLDRSGAPKIVDFGLALLTGQATETRLTQHARVLGTPHYMAPEQIEHPSEVDHRADIYALGVVFYEVLTGELPVGRFPPPSQMLEVDVRLDEVVLRTLDKDPHRRYQHARQLSSDVERSASGADPRRHRETSRGEDWTPTRRGRRRGLWRPEFEGYSSLHGRQRANRTRVDTRVSEPARHVPRRGQPSPTLPCDVGNNGGL